MALFKIQGDSISAIERTSFAQQNIKERSDIQKMLKQKIDIISPNTLVVAEEFGNWENSRRRIDLLGVDKDANLVVIEIKRTEDGGHMELQSIRYASMISTLTFDKLVPIYEDYLTKNNIRKDAAEDLLEFLGWNEIDEDNFAQEVKIVLASAEFSKELTTSVMWLNDFGIDIRCVRMHPYVNGGEVFIDIQTVIPIPEVADYQVRIREKKQRERESRLNSRDLTKFDLSIVGQRYASLSKRRLMFHIIQETIKSGVSPDDIIELLPSAKCKIYKGTLNTDQLYEVLMADDKGGKVSRAGRYFSKDGEFFYHAEKTYVFSNQWGKPTLETVSRFSKAFHSLNITIQPVL